MRNQLSITLAIVSLVSWQSSAARLVVDPVEIAPGGTREVAVSLSGASTLSGVQFDLTYPSDLIASDSAMAGSDLPAGCVVDSERISDSGGTAVRRILIYSSENLPFADGAVIRVPITAAANAPLTTGDVLVSGVSAADGNANPVAVDGGTSTLTVRQITTYVITSSVIGSDGTISPLGETALEQGADQTFTIAPAEGYLIDQLFVDAEAISPVERYTFASITANHEISVSFRPIPSADIAITYAPPSGGGNGFGLLNLSGTSGSTFQIEGSTNLLTWKELGTVTISNGTGTFDLTPFLQTTGAQFFRGRVR